MAEAPIVQRQGIDAASLCILFLQIPLAIDVLGTHVVVASAPLEILVLRVDLTGELTPLGTPTAKLQGSRFKYP